jgi:hypothetical protein
MKKIIFGGALLIAAVAALGLVGNVYVSETIIPVPTETPTSTPREDVKPVPQKPEDLISVSFPEPDDFISSPLTITGKARGYWFFEASFPVTLLGQDGKELVTVVAQAQDEWMTENFVPFKATVTFKNPGPGKGTLVFKKDNPSGLPEHDAEIRVPIRFEPPSATGEGDDSAGQMPPCRVTGCSGQICSDKEVVTTCEYRTEYACYKSAECTRQASGKCGWSVSEELDLCLQGAAMDAR